METPPTTDWNFDIVNLLLASTVVSGIVSAVITWLANVYLSNRTFKREYYKQLIAKRLVAYQSIEIIVADLAGTMIVDNRHRIPMVFSDRERHAKFYFSLAFAMQQSIWLTKKTEGIITQINQLLIDAGRLYHLEKEDAQQVDFWEAGKASIDKLHNLRSQLLQQVRIDFGKLHNVSDLTKR